MELPSEKQGKISERKRRFPRRFLEAEPRVGADGEASGLERA